MACDRSIDLWKVKAQGPLRMLNITKIDLFLFPLASSPWKFLENPLITLQVISLKIQNAGYHITSLAEVKSYRRPTRMHLQRSHCAPVCRFSKKRTPAMYYFIEKGQFSFDWHHTGDNKTRCTGAFVPHTPLSGCSVLTSPGWWKLFNCSNKKQTINPANQKAESLDAGIIHLGRFSRL